MRRVLSKIESAMNNAWLYIADFNNSRLKICDEACGFATM